MQFLNNLCSIFARFQTTRCAARIRQRQPGFLSTAVFLVANLYAKLEVSIVTHFSLSTHRVRAVILLNGYCYPDHALMGVYHGVGYFMHVMINLPVYSLQAYINFR